MRFMHVLAGVPERPAGRLADPEGPHELKALQLAPGVPILQVRVHIEFRVCDDLVAEAFNDHCDGVDTSQPLVKALFYHGVFSFYFLASMTGKLDSAGPIGNRRTSSVPSRACLMIPAITGRLVS